jgi:Ferritin-like domain
VVSRPRDGRSRRALLGGAVAAAGTVVLAGCGGSSGSAATDSTTGTSPSADASPRDVELLTGALELERRTVAAYVASIPLLDTTTAKAATMWMSAEIQHTGALIGLIFQAGAKAGPRANSYDIGPLPSSQDQALARLASFEQLQISYYLRIISRLQLATARATVSSILSDDAQHIALLRLAQGKPAVPSAFVT